MTGPAWGFLVVALVAIALYVVTGIELDRRTEQRDRLAVEARILRAQRNLADYERAALQARIDGAVDDVLQARTDGVVTDVVDLSDLDDAHGPADIRWTR